MMVKIKDIKHGQIFYGMSDSGEPYQFKAWKEPFLFNNIWQIKAEDAGNYSYTFNEDDERILFLSDSLDEL